MNGLKEVSEKDFDECFNRLLAHLECQATETDGVVGVEQGCSWVIEDEGGESHVVCWGRQVEGDGLSPGEATSLFFSCAPSRREARLVDEAPRPYLKFPLSAPLEQRFCGVDEQGHYRHGRLTGLAWTIGPDWKVFRSRLSDYLCYCHD